MPCGCDNQTRLFFPEVNKVKGLSSFLFRNIYMKRSRAPYWFVTQMSVFQALVLRSYYFATDMMLAISEQPESRFRVNVRPGALRLVLGNPSLHTTNVSKPNSGAISSSTIMLGEVYKFIETHLQYKIMSLKHCRKHALRTTAGTPVLWFGSTIPMWVTINGLVEIVRSCFEDRREWIF